MASTSVFKIEITNGTCAYCVTVLLPIAVTHNGSVADFYTALQAASLITNATLHIKQTSGQGTLCVFDALIVGTTQTITITITFSDNDIVFGSLFKIVNVTSATPTQIQVPPGGTTQTVTSITTTLDAGCCDVAELHFDACCVDWENNLEAIQDAYSNNVQIDWCDSSTQPHIAMTAERFKDAMEGGQGVFCTPTECCPTGLTLQQFLDLSNTDCGKTDYHIDWSQVHTLSVSPSDFPLFGSLNIPSDLGITVMSDLAQYLCCKIQNLTILLTPGTYNAADLLAFQNAFTTASCASTTCCTSTCTGTGNCHINFSCDDTSGDVIITGSTTGLNFVGNCTLS